MLHILGAVARRLRAAFRRLSGADCPPQAVPVGKRGLLAPVTLSRLRPVTAAPLPSLLIRASF